MQKKDPLITVKEIEQIITVPSTYHIIRPPEFKVRGKAKHISKEKMGKRVNEVRKFLSQRFGGYTSVKGGGGWWSNDAKKLIKEDVAKVTGFANESEYKKNKNELKNEIFNLGKKWGQESMAFERKGKLYFYNIPEWERRGEKTFGNNIKINRLKARIRRRKR